MLKHLLVIAITPLFIIHTERALSQVNNPGNVAKQDASNHANNDVNNSINNGLNKVDNSLKGLFKKKKKNAADTTQKTVATPTGATGTGSSTTSAADASAGAQASLTSYQNYDFVPGNTILFEDQFADDQSGEFPSHWDLRKGQATLNMQGSDKAFFMTDGNYCVVLPLMKTKSYLTDNFSIEYDLYGNYAFGLIIEMVAADGQNYLSAQVTADEAIWQRGNTQKLSASLPADIAGRNFGGKWHHVAIAYKNDQMKVYVDKYRALTVPHCGGLKPATIEIDGIGDQNKPIIFKDLKIADGVQMYMLGQKFTDAKIVTHGINFDVDKATIKPESMGTLNMVVHVLQDNPDLKFEVDGHTDNSGTAAHNLTLSQQRADAVKTQLISMGIDASRLTSKGFGDTKPMSDNSTLEGKANNRRVEFVRM
ncbi:OmpA family protein [Puia dinghuensis]|uniref:OmpA-like domain-containing protein n=1 Tax=Puia dinghuensis TaxID=1792502 RepID=A0A8J2U7R7_9BACT|nr:OmpA family protein [Puia dinghuensis]GGA84786.1 hypothetical protein GCM10011511_04770 [Puia dinghuensis]